MKVKSETIFRSLLLMLSLANQAFAQLGIDGVTLPETLYKAGSVILTIAAAVLCWWKNNSFTESAIIADNYLQLIRGEDEAVYPFIDDELSVDSEDLTDGRNTVSG